MHGTSGQDRQTLRKLTDGQYGHNNAWGDVDSDRTALDRVALDRVALDRVPLDLFMPDLFMRLFE